ncbi:MAG TPA: LuxR C-terminal-related transcriptional regulator [Pseudonocardiaceae bacterium]|nr:LuxR C-terminal-related transcriptional regulator [Pseudonocardiaceae bacterium]
MAGLVTILRSARDIELVPAAQLDTARVAVVADYGLTGEAAEIITQVGESPGTRAVLLFDDITEDELGWLAGRRVFALRSPVAMSGGALTELVRLAHQAGAGSSRPAGCHRLGRHCLTNPAKQETTLDSRERALLALLAEGLSTAEVARRLSYSERSVKAMIHRINSRLGARNRTHAVARAIEDGLI